MTIVKSWNHTEMSVYIAINTIRYNYVCNKLNAYECHCL